MGEPVEVLDFAGDELGVEDILGVFDDVDVPVFVFVRPGVRVLVVDPVCVFVPRGLGDCAGDAEEDFEELLVLVDVMVDVVVLVVVVEGLTAALGFALRVSVVDFVEVFD